MVSDVTECLLTLYVVDLDSLLVSTTERLSMQGKSAISHSARSHLFVHSVSKRVSVLFLIIIIKLLIQCMRALDGKENLGTEG